MLQFKVLGTGDSRADLYSFNNEYCTPGPVNGAILADGFSAAFLSHPKDMALKKIYTS